MPKLTAILDADVLVYEAAVAAEEEFKWDDHLYTYVGDMDEAQRIFCESIQRIMDELGADDYRLPLTDLDANWRLDILSTYKGNRKGIRRPLLRRALAEWVMNTYTTKAFLRPRLEGDDVAGILLTNPVLITGDRVLVSIDKDMKTIPGEHYNPRTGKRLSISQNEADYWLMYQTLTGDVTDGYAGCPGCGPVTAEKKLLAVRDQGLPAMWAAVVKLFAKAKLTEADALVQARVARILRHGDYDYKERKPILWTPPMLPAKKRPAKKRTRT